MKVTPDLTQDRTSPYQHSSRTSQLFYTGYVKIWGWGLVSRRRKERLVRLGEELASKE